MGSMMLRCYDRIHIVMDGMHIYGICIYTGQKKVYRRTYGSFMLWICGSCGLGSWLELGLCTTYGYFALVCVGMHEGLAQVRAGDITYENHNENTEYTPCFILYHGLQA